MFGSHVVEGNVFGELYVCFPLLRFPYVAIFKCAVAEKRLNANLNNSLNNFILHCMQKPFIRYFKEV